MSEPKIIFDFDPFKLPPEYLRAIGLVSVAWAQTEEAHEQLIGAILGLNVLYAAAVTTHMTGPLRDHVLRSAAEIRIDDLDVLDELDVLLDRFKEAVEKRNPIAHQSWCTHPATGQVYRLYQTARGSIDTGLVAVSVKELLEDAVFIHQIAMDIVSFQTNHGFAPIFPPTRIERAHKTKAARKARRKKLGKH
jgi:hypothetical protein